MQTSEVLHRAADLAVALARASRRVIEVLRACAVIEESRERQPVEAVLS